MAGRVPLLCLLFCLSLVHGVSIKKELDVTLGLNNVRAVLHDADKNIIWVGGTSLDNDKAGKIVGVKVGDKTVIQGPTTSAPIYSGFQLKNLIYFGQENGEIHIFDTESLKVSWFYPPAVEMNHINYIAVSDDQTKVWLAFRKSASNMDNWCFQQKFTTKVPTGSGKLEPLVPDWNAFSGRHPGPCTGMTVDKPNGRVYYTDSHIRGRWMSTEVAFTRQEAGWNNYGYIEKSIFFNGAMYFLMRTGKVESWTEDDWTIIGDPKAERSVQVDLGERFSFEMWRTLVPDSERESIWVASEDGELVQFLASKEILKQVAAMKSKDRRWGEGVVVGSQLVLADGPEDGSARLVFIDFASSCPISPDLDCFCKTAENEARECVISRESTISRSISVPPNTKAVFSKDLKVESGAIVSLPLSSSISCKGTMHFEHAALEILASDGEVGETTIVDGSTEGSFQKKAKVSMASIIKRVLRCGQIPVIKLTMSGEGLRANVRVYGFQKCPSMALMGVVHMLLLAVAGAVGYYFYLQRKTELIGEGVKKGT